MKSRLFSSAREGRLWAIALLIVVTIYASLARAPEVAAQVREQNLAALLFGAGLILTIFAILAHGLMRQPSRAWIGLAIGITAVYTVTYLRIEILEERSHLMEYSILALYIFQALLERERNGRGPTRPALWAIGITIALGWIDEGIQAWLPNRVYAFEDVLFNSLAALMAVSASAALAWVRGRRG